MPSKTLQDVCSVIKNVQNSSKWNGGILDGIFMNFISNYRFIDFTRDFIYGHDEGSKDILDFIISYRTARAFFSRDDIPFNIENAPYTKEQWAKLEQKAESIHPDKHAYGDYILDRIDVWLLESYTLPNLCQASPGDIIFDCGAFTGNTSMYFSKKVGRAGYVYSFEPSPGIYAKLKTNLRNYKNCSIYPFAVSKSNQDVFFDANNSPASRIKESGITVGAVTLDSFAQDNCIPRVDFIKMDIEGAEADAIEGAKAIIQRYTPKMALSAYHKPLDFVTLPQLILSINDKYAFYLRHYSNCECETVLFCVPADSQNKIKFDDKTTDDIFDNEYLLSKIISLVSFEFQNLINQRFPITQNLLHKVQSSYNEILHEYNNASQMVEKLYKENIALHKEIEIIRRHI